MQGISGTALTCALLCLLLPSAVAADVNSGDSIRHFSLYASDPGGPDQTRHSAIPAASQKPGSLPRASTVQRVPMTGSEKWHYYLESTYGPKSIAYSLFGAAIGQARDKTSEWGQGMEGYSKRFGSNFGQKAIKNSVWRGLGGLLHEDPRYFPSERSGVMRRALYAAGQVLVSHKDSGGTRFAYSRFAGNGVGIYVSRQWHPEDDRDASDYLLAFAISFGSDAGKNIFKEFWPDVKKRLPFAIPF